MKKYKKQVLLLPLVVAFLLASCGNETEEVTAMERESETETSTSELLIDSLEYLLREEDTPSDEASAASSEEQTAKDEMAQEEEEPQAEVMIYYGNGASDELNAEVSVMEQVTAENLIDALLKHNIVSLGTKVNSFEEEEKDGVKALRLDLSQTFYDYLKTMSKEGEKIIMYSIAATFMDAYKADEIVITVDGEALETEHASYKEPFRYTPGQLKALEGE